MVLVVPGEFDRADCLSSPRCGRANGPIILSAGPAGIIVADMLREQGVPFVILGRDDNYIASMWHRRVYDRLRLHLPKQFGHRRQLAEHLEISPTKLDIEQELGGGRSAAPGSRASRSCAEPWPAPRGSSRRSSSRPPRAGRPWSGMLWGRGDRDPRQRTAVGRSRRPA
uniref:indole-3-pyruvate monooxygenase n=1 Tax=Hordeum vulgare subsp. vulgare TaxID=112509 RepID=A0A8I6X1F7_HORVV